MIRFGLIGKDLSPHPDIPLVPGSSRLFFCRYTVAFVDGVKHGKTRVYSLAPGRGG